MNQPQLSPYSKKEIEKIAYDLIKSKYGNIPYPDTPEYDKNNNIWFVPIKMRYPRILFNDSGMPKKQRFMPEKKLGEIKISGENGEINEKPMYWDISQSIKSYLEGVRTTVEKALVKVGADMFSQLPFARHMNTPIVDVLSYMLTVEKIDLTQELQILNEESREKYMRHIKVLEKVGLLDIQGNVAFPGEYLVEIESKGGNISNKLFKSLSVFFSNGYDMIHSIREVLGSHLAIGGIFYENSLQYNEIVQLKLGTIESAFLSLPKYGRDRIWKIPRYLAELEKVGLLEDKEKGGNVYWQANEEVYNRFTKEAEILSPIVNNRY